MRVPAVKEPAANPTQLALFIGNAAMRSRLAVALVMEGLDVLIAASLDDVRGGMSLVTDRALQGDGQAGAVLYAVAVARDEDGGLRVASQVAIAGSGIRDVMLSVNALRAGRG